MKYSMLESRCVTVREREREKDGFELVNQLLRTWYAYQCAFLQAKFPDTPEPVENFQHLADSIMADTVQYFDAKIQCMCMHACVCVYVCVCVKSLC
jgi:hypothetical protein